MDQKFITGAMLVAITIGGMLFAAFVITPTSNTQMLYHRCGNCRGVNAIEPNQVLYCCKRCRIYSVLADWRAVENSDYTISANEVP